jgi:hypothetical protein
MTKTILLGLALLVAGLSAPLRAADPDPVPADLQAETTARLFKPIPGKAVIYLLRERNDLWTLGVPVYLDGRNMGSTEPMTYMRWEVEPGPHVVVSDASPPAALQVNTEPGGVYYVWQDLNPGHHRSPSALYLVDQTTARAVVGNATLLKSQ